MMYPIGSPNYGMGFVSPTYNNYPVNPYPDQSYFGSYCQQQMFSPMTNKLQGPMVQSPCYQGFSGYNWQGNMSAGRNPTDSSNYCQQPNQPEEEDELFKDAPKIDYDAEEIQKKKQKEEIEKRFEALNSFL